MFLVSISNSSNFTWNVAPVNGQPHWNIQPNKFSKCQCKYASFKLPKFGCSLLSFEDTVFVSVIKIIIIKLKFWQWFSSLLQDSHVRKYGNNLTEGKMWNYLNSI